MFNHPALLQLLAEDATEQHRKASQTHPPGRTPKKSGPVRHALASYLVRLGLRLDPAAGGGPGASPRKEVRRCA